MFAATITVSVCPQIYLSANDSQFYQDIWTNSSVFEVTIRNLPREISYRVQIAAHTKVGEGVRSEAIAIGWLISLFSQLLFCAYFVIALLSLVSLLLIKAITVLFVRVCFEFDIIDKLIIISYYLEIVNNE